MTLSIKKKVVGCAASAMVMCGMAIIAQIQDNQKIVHASLFSLLGSFHADINVGKEPINATMQLVMIPKVGFLKIIQSTMPITAPMRQNLSVLVQPEDPYFMARPMTIVAPITAPRI